jgi:succinate dehydrogenase/fumarate reductase flavoprotein subunit
MAVSNFPMEVVKVKADVVVVGGGGAASRAAVSAAQSGANVRLVTKVPLKTGGSTVHGASEIMSMGASGFGDKADSAEIHYQDTMRAGRGFIDPALVRVLAEDAPARIRDLVTLGVPLDREDPNQFKLIKSDFGSYARALGVAGKTGKAFVAALTDEIQRMGVAVDENIALIDIIRDGDGAICGLLGYDGVRRALIHYECPSVILGTGGAHGAFEQQVSTAEMTGDGQAICFRHGAELVNLEFHQVGPALIHPYVQLFSGSCFKLHPKLLNSEGQEFVQRYLPPGVDIDEVYDEKVFPFTTVNDSRFIEIAVSREIAAGRGSPRGGVYMSFAHVSPEKIEAGMPNTYGWMRSHGIQPERDRLEVGLAFQCMNGGVRMTGPDAQSSIPGLYVIGELAGGVRGPDRPGGNSLAEGQVFGHRSGVAAALRAATTKAGDARTLDETLDFISAALGRGNQGKGADIDEIAASVRATMQRDCLIEKSADGLKAALERVSAAQSELENRLALTPENLVTGLSTRNLATTSSLILRACLNRDETRSGHYRVDFPDSSPNLVFSFVARRDKDGLAFSKLTY